MVLLYRILDMSGMDAYILYIMHQSKLTGRRDFLKNLAGSLLLPHIQRHAVCSQLRKNLRLLMNRVLGDDMVKEDAQGGQTSQGK